MILPLDGEEDHNGNAFPISSSSSSASSSSCMGESSPESLRSLSSLSGRRTNSPLDYDMFEVTVVATVTTQPDKTTGVDDISVGKIQTAAEQTESNDNSVSVYLDANSEYQQDPWNDNENVTLALSLNMNSGGHSVHDDLSSGSGNERRPSSSCPDSDATEIPGDDDDDDDEDEVLFLSVSSDMGVCKSSMTLISSAGQSSGESVVTTELRTEGSVPVSAADEDGGSEALLEEPDVPSKVNQTEALVSDDPRISSSPPRSAHDAKGVASPPPEGAERCAMDSEPQSSQQDGASKAESPSVTLLASKTGVSTAVQTSSQEAKKASRLDPKLAQSKPGSRPTRSPSKTPTQVSQIYDRAYMCQVLICF